jgi:hypothetical protein
MSLTSLYYIYLSITMYLKHELILHKHTTAKSSRVIAAIVNKTPTNCGEYSKLLDLTVPVVDDRSWHPMLNE